MHWVSREAYVLPANALAEDEPDILEHINAVHAQSLRDYCRLHNASDVDAATMVGIDCDGFDLSADGKMLRFEFDGNEPVTNAELARAALVAMARKAGNS